MKSSPASPFRSERGSLLILAMIVCAVISLTLIGYIRVSSNALKIANRSLYNNGAMNLAERGLEQAIYSLNAMVADPGYDWNAAGWTISGSDAFMKDAGIAIGSQNATGVNRVMIFNYNSSNAPKIVARASVSLGGSNDAPIEKWIEVSLGKTSKFSNGLVARDSILFKGNNTAVDSWNSDPDNDPSTPPIPFSNAVRNDNGSVGSISVSVDSVLVMNADVWGYVSTGGHDPTDSVGTNGSILGGDSVYDASSWTKTTVDPSRVSTEFSHDFDDVSAPTKTKNGTTIVYKNIPAITGNLELPSANPTYATTAADDGYYYYSADQINFNNATFRVSDKVVIELTNSATGIDIGGGSGQIAIDTNGRIQIYTPGSVKIAGQGVSNGTDGADSGTDISDAEMGQPIQFQIYGTKTSGTQPIDVKGNGTFSGTIYAPYGSVTINGNGSIAGSVVANDITMVGNAKFHYDESLTNMGGSNPYRVTKWKELTRSADRTAYSADLSF